MTLKSNAKFKEKLIFCFENDKNLTWALENLKNFHFDWFLVCKVFNVWPKKVHRSYLSWHKSDAKFEKKSDLLFEKWHEEFGKFSQEHSKVLKSGLWWDLFVQSRKCISLNLQRSYVSWQWKMIQKLKRNWIVVLKLTWGIWRILTRAFDSLINLHFKWAPSDQRIYCLS